MTQQDPPPPSTAAYGAWLADQFVPVTLPLPGTGHDCRVMETRVCPPDHTCGDVCARFESDDPTPWIERRKA